VRKKIYYRYSRKNSLSKQVSPDTSLYTYKGLKNDLSTLFRFMNIPYHDSIVSGSWRSAVIRQHSAGLVQPGQISTPPSTVPDVSGMGLKDALYLLENKGLRAVANGRGRVVNQSLAPGSTFKKGEKIILMLN